MLWDYIPAATRRLTGVIGDSVWFNLDILFDGSLSTGVIVSS